MNLFSITSLRACVEDETPCLPALGHQRKKELPSRTRDWVQADSFPPDHWQWKGKSHSIPSLSSGREANVSEETDRQSDRSLFEHNPTACLPFSRSV